MPKTRTLFCEAGQHEWERPSTRGRLPINCPEHKLAVAPIERKTIVSRVNENMIARIDAVWDRVKDIDRNSEDKRVLGFIRHMLSPEMVARRHPENADVSHLHDVAKRTLKHYESVNS